MFGSKRIIAFSFLIFISLWWATTVAQSQNPVILTNEQDHYPLGPHLEILEDKEGTWTIEDVTSPEISSQFVPNQEESPGFGFTDSAYWVRFQVTNKADAATKWLVLLDTGIYYVDYFFHIDNEQGYETVHTGVARSFNTRDLPLNHLLFRLPVTPKDTKTVHMRFESEDTMILSLSIWSEQAYFQQERNDLIRSSFFYGILFILSAYNLVIFLFIRDKSYLFYALFFGTILLAMMGLDGFGDQYLWSNWIGFASIADRFFMILSFSFALLFATSFLRTKEFAPKLHKIMLGIAIALLVGLGLQFIWFRQTAVLHILLLLASCVCMVSAGLVVWRKGYPPARYFLAGWIVVLVGFVIFLLTLIDVLPWVSNTDSIMRIGLVILAFILTLGLADRINQYQQETKTAERLRRTRNELTAVLDVSRDMTSTVDLNSLIALTLNQLERVINYDAASIHLLTGNEFEIVGNKRKDVDSTRPPFQLAYQDIPLFHKLVNEREGFILTDLQSDATMMAALIGSSEAEFQQIPHFVHSFMAVSLVLRNKTIGMLVVVSSLPDAFDSEALIIMQSFANQLAVAIENAQRYDQAQATAVTEERNRLARELHDSVTQSLYSTNLFAEAGREIAENGDMTGASHYFNRIGATSQQALKEMRLFLYQLRPSDVEEDGLVDALQKRLDSVEKRSGMEARLILEGDIDFPDEINDQFFRISQEALNNVVKHAEADKVTVYLQANGIMGLKIVDNGRGFDLNEVEQKGGLGLQSMEERAAQINGKFTIHTAPNQGTTIMVEVKNRDE